MPRILLEDTFDFKPDRSKITESKDKNTGLTSYRIPGVLSVCDTINGNRRRYPKSVWEANLKEGAVLHGLMARKASFGLLEHPADGKVDLRSPISHITTEARIIEKTDGSGKTIYVIEGAIEVLEGTVDGQKLKALILAGYDPLVSSRGYGTLRHMDEENIDEVQDDYVCEGWDVVSTPSFHQAQLTPERAELAKESKPITAPKLSVKENSTTPVTPSSASPLPRVAANEPNKKPTMDIHKIKENISSLKSVVPSTLDARSFASGFQRMSELHNFAAKALSEDATASWEVAQLHKDISALEESWSQVFEAPKAQIKKLTECQNQLLSVVKKLSSHALSAKQALGESNGKSMKSNDLVQGLAKRGRQWMETANQANADLKLMEKKYSHACEISDGLVERYKGDVAQLGVRVLELEYPNLTEEHQKALAEAKTPQQVIAVRVKVEEDLGVDDETDETAEVAETEETEVDPAKTPADAPEADVEESDEIAEEDGDEEPAEDAKVEEGKRTKTVVQQVVSDKDGIGQPGVVPFGTKIKPGVTTLVGKKKKVKGFNPIHVQVKPTNAKTGKPTKLATKVGAKESLEESSIDNKPIEVINTSLEHSVMESIGMVRRLATNTSTYHH